MPKEQARLHQLELGDDPLAFVVGEQIDPCVQEGLGRGDGRERLVADRDPIGIESGGSIGGPEVVHHPKVSRNWNLLD